MSIIPLSSTHTAHYLPDSHLVPSTVLVFKKPSFYFPEQRLQQTRVELLAIWICQREAIECFLEAKNEQSQLIEKREKYAFNILLCLIYNETLSQVYTGKKTQECGFGTSHCLRQPLVVLDHLLLRQRGTTVLTIHRMVVTRGRGKRQWGVIV